MCTKFTFGHEFENHTKDDCVCYGCWNPPTQCKCGGLIHTEVDYEDSEGDCWLFYKCDICGDSYERDSAYEKSGVPIE